MNTSHPVAQAYARCGDPRSLMEDASAPVLLHRPDGRWRANLSVFPNEFLHVNLWLDADGLRALASSLLDAASAIEKDEKVQLNCHAGLALQADAADHSEG